MKTDKKALIFYFSGTGCTEFLVKTAASLLQESHIDCSFIEISSILKGAPLPDISPFSLIGISHPVHSFETPSLVYQFEKLLPKVNSKSLFFLKAAGEEAFINEGASFSLSRKLEKKGYTVIADRTIAMPSNWLWGYTSEVSFKLVADARVKLIDFTNSLAAIVNNPLFIFNRKKPLSLRLISFAGKAEHFGARFFGKDLQVTDTCNKCKLCIKNCPVSNIFEEKGAIHFKFNCLMCMKCVYGCPQNAIHGRLFNAVILKDGLKVEAYL